MREQEGANGLSLVGREIVRDDMNLASLRLTGQDVAEEVHEGRAGVPRDGLTKHFARLGVERGKERQGAVPVVLEAMAFGASGRERQHWIEAVERLNGRFLVDRKD